jgi:hypothetical protein
LDAAGTGRSRYRLQNDRNPPPGGEAAEVPLRIDSGRFGAEEPPAEDPDSGTGKTYTNQWLFLGARLGPSLRFYTPQDDTAFTGGDTYGFSLDMGIQASLQIAPVFSIQAEMVFTWDNASVWEYFFNDKKELDRYTREFTSFSLQFPLTARLNFYSGKFRISPFFGGYVLVPLGPIKTNSSVEDEDSFSWSVSPPLGLLGGLNVGFPLGPGMIFADIRYAADLGEPELDGGDGIHAYRRHMGSLSIGYEFGFFKKR